MTTLDSARTTNPPGIASQFRTRPLRIDEQRFQPDPSFHDLAAERLHRKQQLAGGVPRVRRGSATTSAWPGTSPPATPSSPITSGSTRSRCRSAGCGSPTWSWSITAGEIVIGDRPVNRAGVRHPLAAPRGPPRRHRGRARARGARQGLVLARPAARPHHPGCLPVLRHPFALRRLQRHRRSTRTRASGWRPRSARSTSP